jgi:omega-6 fatty acid desaturase (delta-12 desaturase)
MDKDRVPARSVAEVRRAAAAFAQPIGEQGVLQLLTSFGPFIAAYVAMYLVFPISYPLTLALAVPTGALLVRIFIIQHDCGHGSFFASRWANGLTGRLCSLITLTPFANWGRQHGLHHAEWNNLDRKGGGADIYSSCLTARAYCALLYWRRLLYHPLVANVLLPPLVFVLLYRLPFDTPRTWARERRSVHLTNLALAAAFGALVVLFGWQEVLLIHVPIMVVASIAGVWLFSVQHRFETARWTAKGDWSFADAALQGSSWFGLPPFLHWLTGNIGFHHVHHLNPRVPSYRLRAAHEAVHALLPMPIRPLSVLGALRAPWLTLWDEAAGRLVRFRDVEKASPDHTLLDNRATISGCAPGLQHTGFAARLMITVAAFRHEARCRRTRHWRR